MKKKFLFMILGFIVTITQISAETIKVGGYPFPPFVEKEGSQYSGITIDLINEMNSFQNRYIFEFFPTASRRRYMHFENGSFDVMFFEDVNWGWADYDVKATTPFLEDGEVYVALVESGRGQSYFNNLTNKKLTVISGFHYGFAGYNADPDYLNANYDIQFSTNHEGNIRKTLVGRSDISVVTLSYLLKFLKENPAERNNIIISEKYDQHYNHTILVRDNVSITVNQINTLLEEMEEAGIISRLWEKYGLE